MRKLLALTAVTATTALIMSGSIANASVVTTVVPRPVCAYYTFNQVSTDASATLRTIVGVCTGRPVCERRDLITKTWRIINVSNTCPAVPRR